FEKVEHQNAAAADLLRACAFLAPDAIAEEIFVKGAKHLGAHLRNVGRDRWLLNQAIATLGAYSLVSRDPAGKTLTVHRLVQAVLIDRLQEKTSRQWTERVIRAVHASLPPVEHANWPDWERLVPHAQACAQQIERYHCHFREGTLLLQQT